MNERALPDRHWLPPDDMAGYAPWEQERLVATSLVKLMNGYTHGMLPDVDYWRLRKEILRRWEPFRGMGARQLGLNVPE